MLRFLRLSVSLVIALVAMSGATANAGTSKKVAVGNYQASPIVPSDQDYGVGLFSVEKNGSQRQIVRSEGYLGIYYPDDKKCEDLALPLGAESIPISATGRFKVNEKIPADDIFVQVIWKGRWSKPGLVGGTITIKYDGCQTTSKWTGGKVVATG